MAWGGGVFTRTYGSSAWQTDASNSVGIVADRHDTNDQDLADGINACINKAGGNTPTADLPMGGYKHTNLSAGSAAAPTFCAGNDQDTGMYSPAANTLGFATNGVERVRFTAAGNVGIGTNNPSTTFHLGGSVDQSIQINMNGNAAFCGGVNNTTVLSVNRNPVTGAITDTGKATAEINLTSTSTNGSITFLTTSTNNTIPTERMRVTPTGSVGIGNNAPSSLLEVGNGTGQRVVRINGGLTNSADGAALYIQQGATTNAAFGHYSAIVGGAANGTPTLYSSTDTIFYNGAQRMTITNGGNVGIGVAVPTSQLHLSTDFALKQSSTTWQTVSDGRIKKNITPYEKGLANILQVNPVNFEYNGKAGTVDGVQGISVIAQDIQPIFPEAVGVTITKLNEDDEEPTEILNFTTHAITFALINAIKELSTKLDALTDRVTALEA